MVLAFSFMPCMEEVYAINKEKAHIETSQSQAPVDDNCADGCSPFCSCNCCPGFDFAFANLQIEYLVLSSAEKLVAYLPDDISDITLPVWQPPQLG